MDEKEYYVPNLLYRPRRFDQSSLERRMRDHMSRQMTYVVHGTRSEIPPHEREGDETFHVGTLAAAESRMAPELMNAQPAYLHVYRISRDVMDPVRFGDYKQEQVGDNYMSGLQPQLFESLPFNDKAVQKYISSTGLVTPYRNRQEDRGSTSFLVPKSLMGKGVEYIGKQDTRRKLTPEQVERYRDAGMIRD